MTARDILFGELRPRGSGPLKEFWATLSDFGVAEDEQYGRTLVSLRLTDLDVVDAWEPIPQTEWEWTVSYSMREGTKWAPFHNSLRALMPGIEKLSEAVGCRMLLRQVEAGSMRDEDGEQMPYWSYEVVELQGASAKPETPADLTEYALGLLEGKTRQEFFQLALADPVIQADAELTNTIITQKFFVEYADRLSVDDEGRYTIG